MVERAVVGWRRIHIIGGPGSGKTTLARRIAQRLSVPAYDLDAIAYENGAGQKRPLDVRLAETHAIATQPTWVTEGAYLWWTEALLQGADVIVWLDLPWRVAAWRVLVRHVRSSIAGTNPHRGWRKLLRFLLWTRRYYRRNASAVAPDDDPAIGRAATVACLQPHLKKVIPCRRPAHVHALLAALSRGEPSPHILSNPVAPTDAPRTS